MFGEDLSTKVRIMGESQLRLGEILIDANVLKPEQLEEALALQKKRQLRLGTILLQENYVSEAQLVQALSRRLSIPWVSLWHIDVPDELLDLVPANVAEEFFLIPIYVRTTGSGEKALYVAMNDPTDDSALRFVAASSGMAVKPMIAGPSDISTAIRAYYYDEVAPSETPGSPVQVSRVPPTGVPRGSGHPTQVPPPPVPADKSRGSKPPPPVPSVPPKTASKLPEPPAALAQEETDLEVILDDETDGGDSAEGPAPSVEDLEEKTESVPPDKQESEEESTEENKQRVQREVEKHMFGVGHEKPGKAVSLTLLDGTTIKFGDAAQQRKKSDVFTKEDLIAGLRAAAAGTPVDDFLPSDKWEDYMAALLEILFRKHLVFFEEYLAELKKKKD